MSLALLASCGSGERSPASATDAASDGSNGATEPATDGGSDAADEGAGETMPPMWPDDFDCINMDKAADDACYGEVLFELASEHVVFGDFDGDGHLDVANRVDGQSGTADGLVFHGGLAAGGFAAPVAFALGAETQVDGNPLSLGATRVLTGDSADWLFVQGTYGSFGTVQSDLWWSHGAPALDRFFEPTNAPAGGPWIGDFDGSGPALAFATAGTNLDDLQLYACTASSCDPAGTRTVSGPPSPPWTLLTGDVTGDGLDDLVAITRPPMGGTSEVHVMRRVHDGSPDHARRGTQCVSPGAHRSHRRRSPRSRGNRRFWRSRSR
jgi:hypothetical protein